MSDFSNEHEQLAEKRKYDIAMESASNQPYNPDDFQSYQDQEQQQQAYDYQTGQETAEKKQATDDNYQRNRTASTPFLSVIPTATNSGSVSSTSYGMSSSSSVDPQSIPITYNMSCPQDKVPALIGPKGVTVQSIIKQSGCNKIFVDQDFPDGVPRQVMITGKPQSVSIATSLIAQLLQDGSLIIATQADLPPAIIPADDLPPVYCPHNKVASLIGPQGSHVNEIMRRSGARVQVMQEGVPDGVDRKVSFTGTQEQVLEARKLVQLALVEGPNFLFASMQGIGGSNQGGNIYGGPQLVAGMVATTPTGSIIAEDDIQPEKVRVVIGSKGVTINEMMSRSGCRININQNFPIGMPHKVIYMGSKEQIEVARFLVTTCVEKGLSGLNHVYHRGEKLVFHEVNVLQSQMIRLLGSQGINMGDVQMRLHVKVNVDTVASMLPGIMEPVNKIGLVGHSDNVQEAVGLIYQYVDYINPMGMGGGMGMGMKPHQPQQYPMMYGQQQQPPVAMMGGGYHHGYPGTTDYSHMGMGMGMYGMLGGGMATTAPSSTIPSSSSSSSQQVLGLGEDGSAGQLEPAKILSDGMHQQVAEIKNDAVGRVIGKQSTTAVLIRNKSGANVQIIRPTDPTKISTTIVLTGLPQCVALAAQMVQEVLVNGTTKLQQMNDVPLSVVSGGSNAAGTGIEQLVSLPSPSNNVNSYYPSPQTMGMMGMNMGGGGGYVPTPQLQLQHQQQQRMMSMSMPGMNVGVGGMYGMPK